MLAGPCWKMQRCCRRPVPARRCVRASLLLAATCSATTLNAHGGLQGLSAEMLLSSAGGEEGAEVRRVLGALNAPSVRSLRRPVAQALAVRRGDSELMDAYVKEKVKEVEALDPEMCAPPAHTCSSLQSSTGN